MPTRMIQMLLLLSQSKNRLHHFQILATFEK